MNERQLFEAALDIADPQARQVFLEDACQDPILRAKVESLLKSHALAGSFLDVPAIDPSDTPVDYRVTDTIVGDPEGASVDENAPTERLFSRFLKSATRPNCMGRLAHYEIESLLGQGAFGTVAKAFDEKLHRVVAIKFMSPELASTSPPRKRFLREARTAAAVTHENIVAIHAVEEEPIPYLVMEYIPGKTLQQRMEAQGPLDPAEIVRIGQQVAAGLAAAHAVKLIHRDIKPSNILLTGGPHEKAKISDFGLARAVDDASMTSSGVIAGTPLYMSPEQARGETLDHRTDLFSLGSVLYQLASGRPPFRAANTVAVLKRVCDDAPRPLSDIQPGIPAWLESIICKLLEKKRENRFQSAQELADLLTRCQRELELNGQVTCVASLRPSANAPQNLATESSQRTGIWKSMGWLTGTVVAMTILGFILVNGAWKTPQSEETSSVAASTSPSTTEATAPRSLPSPESTITGWHGWPAGAPKPAIAPFDTEQARKYQEAWAAYLQVPIQYTNSVGMKFHLIPPGEFLMGSPSEELDAYRQVVDPEFGLFKEYLQGTLPPQKITLTRPFYLGVDEVTQQQYQLVMDTNPSYFSATGEGRDSVAGQETGTHPVEMVTWTDAADFCTRLSQKESLKPVYVREGDVVLALEGNGYRLPTDAEWEFSCRSGTTTRYWCGNLWEDLSRVAWTNENSDSTTHPAGGLSSNPWGLFDMHGNVWEWIEDAIDPGGNRSPVDPRSIGQADSMRLIRGGCWFDGPGASFFFLSSTRRLWHPLAKDRYFGFRAHLTVEAVQQALKSQPRSGSQSSGWQGWPADAPKPAIAPFDAEQAKKHQEAWAAFLKIPVSYKNALGMEFRLIPPGEFLMGSPPDEIEAYRQVTDPNFPLFKDYLQGTRPQRRVMLTKPYYLGVHEVTQQQYQRVMGTNPSYFSATGEGQAAIAGTTTSNHPVEMVTWTEATDFCTRLSQTESLKTNSVREGNVILPSQGTGYRLPTDAEWEFACRSGTTTRYWSGDQWADLSRVAWTNENSESKTHPTGELSSNPWGLFDMHGNVWEWVEDAVDLGANQESLNPRLVGQDDSMRLVRGGCWLDGPGASFFVLSAMRRHWHPLGKDRYFGFRVQLSVESVQEALKAPPSTESKSNDDR